MGAIVKIRIAETRSAGVFSRIPFTLNVSGKLVTALVGVPVIWPVDVLNVRLAGKVAGVTDHV